MMPDRLLFTVLTLCLAAFNAVAHARSYTPHDIGNFGGPGRTWANAINNQGQVVGSSFLDRLTRHAFLYNDGQLHDLGTLGGRNSNAAAINDRGQIVGSSLTDEINYYGRAMQRPFIYHNGQMQRIEHEGYASDINDHGLAVGAAALTPGDFRLSLYDSNNGRSWQIHHPDAEWSAGYAINNRGQLVGGFFSQRTEADAFFYDMNTERTQLIKADGYTHVTLTDINDAGTAVGTAFGGHDTLASQGAIWQDGQLQLLQSPHLGASTASGINRWGDVVGSWHVGDSLEGEIWHAFLLHDGQWLDLNDYVQLEEGYWLYRAVAINDHGDIVAYSNDGRNFLLNMASNAPEPESWALLGSGMLALWLRRRQGGRAASAR